jgi:hypothetical protein
MKISEEKYLSAKRLKEMSENIIALYEAQEKNQLIPPLMNYLASFHFDVTPDSAYPIRLLGAYSRSANVYFANEIDESGNPILVNDPTFSMMNEHQARRIVLVNKAIEILQKNLHEIK